MVVFLFIVAGVCFSLGGLFVFLAFVEEDALAFFIGLCMLAMAGLLVWGALDTIRTRNQLNEWETTYNIDDARLSNDDTVTYYRGTRSCSAEVVLDKLVNESCESEVSNEIPSN